MCVFVSFETETPVLSILAHESGIFFFEASRQIGGYFEILGRFGALGSERTSISLYFELLQSFLYASESPEPVSE